MNPETKRLSDVARRIPVLLVALAYPLSLIAAAPEGWHLAGSAPNDYETGISDGADDSSAAYLKSVVDSPRGFGTLMQTFSAVDYRGQRLRLSGAVRTNDVGAWAGLWMRIDGRGQERLGFDNMQDRPILGSTDWNRYEVILDVPEQSEAIAFGVLLVGQGEVHLDDLRFEVVGQDVAVTGNETPGLRPEPANLSFED